MKKFQKEDILNDMVVKNFLNNRNTGNSSNTQYVSRIKSYCDFTGKTPTELIDESLKEQNNGINFDDRIIMKYLHDFFYKLIENGKSENTVKAHYETINGLYKDNNIEIPDIKNKFKVKDRKTVLERPPTKDHIRKALKYSNLRDKAIILLQFSSGMSGGAVRNLTYGQFYNSIDEYIKFYGKEVFDTDRIYYYLKNRDDIIGIWNLVHINSGFDYLTCNSSESNKAIIDYLRERNNVNPINSFDDPLFIANGDKIEKHTFSLIYHRINQRANLGLRNEKRNFLTSNIPRKMFHEALLNSGADYLAVGLMMGYKKDNIKLSYYKNNPDALKMEYLKGIKNITLEEVKIEIVTTERYDDILQDLKREKEIRKEMEYRITKLEAHIQPSELIKISKDEFEKEGYQAFRNIKK